MATATTTKTVSAPEAARKTKLRHAHFLTNLIFHYCVERESRYQEAIAAARAAGRKNLHQELLGEFQKELILETAAKLGFPVQSRKDLSAMQLGAVCGDLRKKMAERGIPIPHAHRSSRAKSRDLLDSDAVTQEEQQLMLDLLGRTLTERDWTQPQAEQWLRRQLHRWNLDWPQTHGQARAVIFGLKGILRHNKEAA